MVLRCNETSSFARARASSALSARSRQVASSCAACSAWARTRCPLAAVAASSTSWRAAGF